MKRPESSSTGRRKRFVMIAAALLIASMLAPIVPVGVGAAALTRSGAPAEGAVAPPPSVEPPRAFAVGEPVATGSDFVESVRREMSEVWYGPQLPEEFRAAKVPSLPERVGSKVGRLFAAGEAVPAAVVPPPPAATPEFDFDGDGKADASRWRSAATQFSVRQSNSGGAVANYTLGSSTGKPAPADYDGDGKTDLAVFDAGAWTIRKSSDGTTTTITGFGQSGDVPVSANFTGSGTDDNLAVYRPSNGTWYWREFASSTVTSMQYGLSTDIPAAGDFDDDGDAEPAVYRPSNGTWYISSIGGHQWGLSTDIPVAADYSGDGRTELAVYRPSAGTWWILNPADWSYSAENWGNYADQPAPADYDGDGKADRAVWRPTSGVWFVNTSGAGADAYYALGSAGDLVLPSAYVKQVGGSVATSALAKARLAPSNATGGTNVFSGNFAWGTSLVSLPGRSGLDLNIGLSYNSLVWTTEGSTVHFDPDYGNVSPGFNLGFPTVEPAHYDAATGKWSFLMVTPAGARVEFRQTGATSVYETADGSYAQLEMKPTDQPNDPPENILFAVRTTDGTSMSYEWKGGAFRCKRITDRNGNYISLAHNDYGFLETATDTLGRVVTVNYDAQFYPTSVTQTWKADNGAGANVTRTWASFAYTNVEIQTDFDGVTVAGPPNGTYVKVLEKVTYRDTSWTKFLYNGYGQVKRVENYADDDHLLNYTRTNLDSVAADQTDCPRFTLTATKTENFNLSGGAGTEQETVVTNSAPAGGSVTLPGSLSVSGKFVDVGLTGHPDGLYSRVWYGGSGFKEGLTLATQDCTGANCANVKRWTWADWTQDDTGASYPTNPRVVESRIGDGTNTKRTTVEYTENLVTGQVLYGLPKTVQVYDTDLSTVIKKSATTYNLDAAYLSRRIIGIPAATESWGKNDLTSGLELVSKVTYAYDEGDFSDTALQQNISPVQHDATNYGGSFSYRGNPTSTKRWDVTQPTSSSAAITTASLKYNTAGGVVARITPWDGTNTRTVKIVYADAWNSSGNPTTYAYPTSITDPANNASTVKYRYDIGANVEANSPAPAGNTYGKTTKRVFDSIGRLQRDSVYVNTTEHSYVRHEYPANGVQSKTYAPLVDVDGDGDIAEDEVYSETWHDGAGRVRMARTEHPGSTGGWAATLTEYDVLGRTTRQSVPTEVSVSGTTWTPAGDDAARGYLWTHQRYDWMGRVVRRINTDGDPLAPANDSDVFLSYAGCGCAGGLETTVEGEQIVEKDWNGSNPTSLGRRKQKIYSDGLGREFKAEVFQWNGTNVYLTTERKFDGRDQVLQLKRTEASTSTVQTSTRVYDGFGQMTFQHLPIQAAGRGTSFEYFPDGSIKKKTDARGAAENYQYNIAGLPQSISYDLPTSDDGLTPLLSSVSATDSNTLVVRGKGFAGNVEVKVSYFSGQVLPGETVGSGSITHGTDGDFETLTFDVSNSNVLAAIANSPPSYYVQVVNPATGQSSPLMLATSFGGTRGDAPVPASTVTYQYDTLGNRVAMNDALGTVGYEYDSLSRLTEEARAFTDIASRTFAIQYTYGHTGTLKTVENPFDQTVTYNRDKVGRLTSATGAGYNYSEPFVENMKYRAWGAMNQAEYGHGGEMNISFDSTLRPTEYSVAGLAWNNTPYTRGSQYAYYADGQLRKVDDLSGNVFDKSYKYDHTNRLKEALSGFEARGETSSDPFPNRPYHQTYEYNAFGDRTGGIHRLWRMDMSSEVQHTFVDGRRVGIWGRSENDADGRPLGNTVNAAGRIVESVSPDLVGGHSQQHWWQPSYEITQKFDGGGRIGYRKEIRRHDELSGAEYIVVSETTERYLINSTVLGGVAVADAEPDGNQSGSNVYANGSKIASQTGFSPQYQPPVSIHEVDPLSGTTYRDGNREDRTPEGGITGQSDPWAHLTNPGHLDVAEQPMIEGVNAFTPCGTEIDGLPATGMCGSFENGTEIEVSRGGRFVGVIPLADVFRGPGGSISVWIPGDLGRGEGSEPTVLPEGAEPDNWELIGGPQGEWFTFEFEDYRYLTDEEKRINQIKDIINYAKKQPKCTEAFRAAGATPIGEQLDNLTVVTENIFKEPLYDKSYQNWTRGTDVGSEMRALLKEKPSTRDISTIGTHKYLRSDFTFADSNHRFLGVTNAAFDGKEHLSVTIIHSLVHTGGIAGQEGGFSDRFSIGLTVTSHDLKHLGDKYKDILKHCTRERGSKLLQ